MRFLAILALAGSIGCATAAPQQAPAAPALPSWWLAHVEFMTRDGGTWVTPNPANEKDASQPDAYAMEWRAASENHLLTGRLYGVEAGAEVAEYWTFREFWHPGERRAIAEQWGSAGAYGAGESSWHNGEGVLDQTFWLPDGRSWREGHRNQEQGDVYITRTYDISASGEWSSSSSFVWRRQPAPQ